MKITKGTIEMNWDEARFLADQIQLARKANELSREGHLRGLCECDVVWDNKGITVELVEGTDVLSDEIIPDTECGGGV